jgi:hypothetical protein
MKGLVDMYDVIRFPLTPKKPQQRGLIYILPQDIETTESG